MLILKRKSAEQVRLEGLLGSQEEAVRRAFAQFLADARSDAVLREIAQLIERGAIEDALKIVDTYIIRLGTVIPTIIQAAGTAEVASLAADLASRVRGIGISFDPTNPRAAALMRNASLEFVQDTIADQRNAIRNALTSALQDGTAPRQAARAFRDAIGLTTRQEAAVRNYANLLRSGSSEALARDLRDRRFDPTVARALESGEPLSEKQIDWMTERYRQRYLAYRSETIARTEAVPSISAARHEAMMQTLEQTGIGAHLVERSWHSAQDARTRDSHRTMNGQTVQGMDQPFTSGHGNSLRFPGDPRAPISETANCRCAVTFRIKPIEEALAA